MTQPDPHSTPYTERPAWQHRLLGHIQKLQAEHLAVLRQGYDTTPGGSDAPVHAWRARLRAVAATRDEAETRARALGIGRVDILVSQTLGMAGYQPDPPADPVRDSMIDGVAADVWQLQHMAALHTVHQGRPAEQAFFLGANPGDAEQVERNMHALWRRAGGVAAAIGLTADEYAGMWTTDAAGWRRIFAASVDRYDEDGIEERWRVYAWPGIEIAADREVAALGSSAARREAVDPVPIPTPATMLSHALEEHARSGVDYATVTEAIDAALEKAFGRDWTGTDTAHDPGTTPQSPDPAAEPEP
ncbi:hypothetical protein [Nocardia wallacei]|uniref:hypothetical protein n=1 Tax=Nocardia wallacei TaxID=480035 RepID=UPI002454A85F|nr:hypothetical protein [Nocardia wallacei]